MAIVRDGRRLSCRPGVNASVPRHQRVEMLAAFALISCVAWLSLGGAAFALSRRVNGPAKA